MIETVRCPSCQATYGLKAERVHAGIRRARCARCPEIFPISEEVNSLLRPVPAEPAFLQEAEPLKELDMDALAAPDYPEVDFEETPELDSLTPELETLTPESIPETAEAMPVLEMPLIETPAEALDFLESLDETVPPETPSLSMQDLEGADEEILEKTMLMEVIPAAPADEEGFSSAKDAISKILGGLDAPEGHAHPHAGRISRNQGVDMEATLDALDQSLGQSKPESAPTAPGTATTVRISIEDIRAAIASTPDAMVPGTTTEPVPTPSQAAPAQPAASAPVQIPSANRGMEPQDPNLLKIQVGGETYTNVTVEQLTRWIEEGRVLETHQVARQYSDHWIEAVKVPALRPTFDKMRRARIEAGAPSSVLDESTQKKGIFSGLWGR